MARLPTVITPPARPIAQKAPRPLARFALPAVGVAVIVLLIVGGAVFGPRVFNTAAGTPTAMSAAIVEASPSPTRTISPSPTLPPTPTPTVTPTGTPRPTATPIPIVAFARPILAAIANRTPDFQDDFSAPAFWRWSGVEASCAAWRIKFSDGALVVANCLAVSLADKLYEDFVVEVEGQFLADTSDADGFWGLLFGFGTTEVARQDNVVRIRMNGDAEGILEGQFEKDIPQDVALPGLLKTNHLTLIARGRQIAFYVNRQPVFLWEAAPPQRGYFGLTAGAGGTVSFDNLKVWDISDLSLTAPTPELPTATSTSAAASPDTGTVEGRTIWNGEPIAGVTVKLCTKWVFKCETTEYSAVSDAQGRYTITRIPPGDYNLITKMPDQKGEVGAIDQRIKINAGLNTMGDTPVCCKQDLQLISPAHEATVSSTTPTLSWKAYPLRDELRAAPGLPWVSGH